MKRLWGCLRNFMVYSCGMLLVCCILLCPVSANAQDPGTKRVLFISSYSYDFVSVPHQIEGIKDALGNDAELHYVFMNAKHLGSALAEQNFYHEMQVYKNLNRQYDAVILGDDDALNFMRKYRQEFFVGVPIVYTGINIRDHALAAYEEGMTGTIEQLSFIDTIQAAEKLMPSATRVVGITDDTPTGQGNLIQFQAETTRFPELEFEYINTSQYTQQDLAEKLSTYDNNTILMLITFTDDRDGHRYTNEQCAEFVAAHAKIPFFSATELGFGTGAIGGNIISMRDMAYQSGMMVRRVLLNGDTVASIEPQVMHGRNSFDAAVMERFHIKTTDLPADSTLINEKKNFFVTYRIITIPALCIFIVLLIWLAREMINSRRRRKILKKLAANSIMMKVAMAQSGLHVWEYFPETHRLRMQRDFNRDIAMPEWVDNYPQCWVDGQYVYPDDVPGLLAMVRRLDEGAAEAVYEMRVRYQDNEWHWERLRYDSVYGAQGQRIVIIGTAEKIEAYKALEERFMVSMRQSGIEAWVYDLLADAVVTEGLERNTMMDPMPMTHYPDSLIQAGFVHPDDVPAFRRLYEQIRGGNKSAEATVRWQSEAGQRWLHIVYTVVFDREDRPVKAFGTMMNVTDQKRSEERFQAELRRTMALEGETLASSYFDLTTGEIYEWNYENTVYATSGLSWFEGVADAATHIPDETERAYYLEHLNQHYLMDQYEQGTDHFTMDYRRRTMEGKVVWARTYVHVSKHYGSGHLSAYVYTRDINQTKLNELALDSIIKEEIEYLAVIELEQRYEHIIKTRPGCEFHEQMAYPYALQWQRVEQHVVAEDKELVHRQLDLDSMVRTLDKGENCIVYYREPDEEGHIRRKRTTVYYLDDRKQTLVYVRSDITELYEEEQRQKEQLEAALKRTETANRAKSDFLSHMSHEIRTPMNAIIGLATLIAERTTDVAYVEENIEKVNMSAHFLLALINDILDISRIESGQLELKDNEVRFSSFVNMINTMIQGRADEKDVHYESIVGKGLAKAYQFDELKLKQVLINILSNAVKFTPSTGRVVFRTEKYGSTDDADLLRFSIMDTGIGIAKEFLPKVFDAFAQEYGRNTTLYGGTGLGLAISNNIVKLMGGHIDVHSVKGEGTTFTVELALKRVDSNEFEVDENPAEAVSKKEHADFTKYRLLLAEDNAINREIAQTILQQHGFAVETVTNGQEAVLAFMGHECGYYDVILMDIRMPVMDGLEATREIRASRKEDAATIPILAMTANAFEEDVRKSLAAGMNAHLAKPIDPDVLIRRLSEFL